MKPDGILSLGGSRAYLVGVRLLSQPAWEVEEHLDELEELTRSAGARALERTVQTRKAPDPATFIGSGKARRVGAEAAELGCTVIVFDDDLSPSQIKNLEKIIELPVIDRSALILQIFHQRARTREARTQVELARLKYMLPRLTRLWTHLGRQEGATGMRGGMGEKQIEVDRRILRRRIEKLEKELDKIARTRDVQRGGRERVIEVALAGYTNVGKSTLFNRLTNSDATVRDKLFATLDARLRQGGIGNGDRVVFADTVGFIRKLPHHLVASFKSTLEEVVFADLVLHVVDRSHPQWEEQQRVAREVLAELGVEEDRIVDVYNKIDRLDGVLPDPEAPLPGARDGAVWVSAITGDGMRELRERIRQRLPDWRLASSQAAIHS